VNGNLRRKLLYRLSGGLQCQLIKVPQEPGGPELPYLERYKLLDLPLGMKLYLHRFVASDPDRGYHNHPWDSVSFPLVGCYRERIFHPVQEKLREYSPGGWNVINQEKFHRVELLTPDAWTLFFRRGTANGWGFIEEAGDAGTWSAWAAEQKVSRWNFWEHYEKTDNPSGWDGIPLGREAGREPIREAA